MVVVRKEKRNLIMEIENFNLNTFLNNLIYIKIKYLRDLIKILKRIDKKGYIIKVD